MTQELKKRAFNFVLAKIMYYVLLPFLLIRKVLVEAAIKIRYLVAVYKANELKKRTKTKHYVVSVGRKFYIYNKGGMMNLAKAYRKRSGHKVEWRQLYCYSTK